MSDFFNFIFNISFFKLIFKLNFYFIVEPSPPVMLLENCIIVDNTMKLEWKDQAGPLNQVDLYLVELDDGLNGSFQVVLKTKETSCILKGLQCSSTYRAKVKSLNSAGESQSGQTIHLTTSACKFSVSVLTYDNY